MRRLALALAAGLLAWPLLAQEPVTGCHGVPVPPTTTDLQAVVNAHPEGTTFCLPPGTYRLDGPVLAKSRSRFLGQPGTILDGQDRVPRGIWGSGGDAGQRDVVVQGVELARFTDVAIAMGWGWTVTGTDLHHNRIGVTVNSDGTLDRNYIHDNAQYGVTGGPGTNLRILDNEIARNNTGHDCGGACAGDAGGSKIIGSLAGTTGLVWRGNYVHDNTGMGIWSDGNVRALYEGNVVWGNTEVGIFHEISWDAIVRDNFLLDNAWTSIGRSCWHGANILLNTSAHVEVSQNVVIGANGANGICVVSSDRGEGAPYPVAVAQVSVHDNLVQMTGPATSGLVAGSASLGPVWFAQNTYRVPDPARAYWTWPTRVTATWGAWRRLGQDATGTLTAQ